jgi:hypothetical protein
MSTPRCPLCNDTGILTQAGIARIYLLARPLPLIMIFAGLVLALWYGPVLLLLALVGYLLPLIGADMRLSLYPIVAISALRGKKANCPECNVGCSVFKEEG